MRACGILGSNPSPATTSSTHEVYRVYVIKNPEGKVYIGLSEDPETRLIQHNTGISKWTRNKGPWELHWQSRELPLTEARKLENLLKRQKGGSGLHTLLVLHGS